MVKPQFQWLTITKFIFLVGGLYFLTRFGWAMLDSRLNIKFMCVTFWGQKLLEKCSSHSGWQNFKRPSHTVWAHLLVISCHSIVQRRHTAKPYINQVGNKLVSFSGRVPKVGAPIYHSSKRREWRIGKLVPSTIWEIFLCQSCIN